MAGRAHRSESPSGKVSASLSLRARGKPGSKPTSVTMGDF